ncbi:MAG: hypothetical protein ACOVO2_14770 [Emticicia sp.]|uniref:hypothetical protein n=1 Tax=Emticicia sp. TaxID=1930953 RepID=UPI003BA3F90E
MKMLLFSLFICTAAAVQAQTLPRSSEKGFTDKLLDKSKPSIQYPSYKFNFDEGYKTVKSSDSPNVITYKMPVRDVKADNSVIKVYKPDSLFKSNMIVKKYK